MMTNKAMHSDTLSEVRSDAETHVVSMHGLRPDNPLGFLVGLGSIRTLSDHDAAAGWELLWGPDHAKLRRRDGQPVTKEGVAKEISDRLGRAEPLLNLKYPKKGDKEKNAEDYEKFSNGLSNVVDAALKNDHVASARRLLDFQACIACYNPHSGKGYERVKDIVVENKLRMVTGNTTLFNTVSRIIEKDGAGSSSIYASLFEPWTYLDDGYSLNWDPNLSGRTHATAPSAPESAFNPSMYGANRIAFEALSLYPVVDDGREIQTVGWTKKEFTWPVWDCFAGMDEIRGILSTDYKKFKADELTRMGIKRYSSEKIDIDYGKKQKRFTSARPV